MSTTSNSAPPRLCGYKKMSRTKNARKKLPAHPCIVVAITASAQQINPALLNGGWSAQWITCPDVAPRDYGVYHFRKTFKLENLPAKLVVHVSADNRYRLFVNGKAVCSGPARGDLYNWYFET
jgi:alpha-L-rhamnosidase